MANKKIVAVLGRKALSLLFPDQRTAVLNAANAIADLVEEKYDIVITHSNAEQVGMIHTAMSEFSRLDQSYPVAPMSICSAMSQGYIGYDLQNAIRSELIRRGIYKPVSTIITQVRVDPFDPAFSNPTKVIGRYMSENDSLAEEAKGNYTVKEEQGYRRIIASPKPIDIYEIDAIRTLLDAGQLVIAGGGGGIPVLQQHENLKGASAIIEKDYTGARLAELTDADTLIFLTGVEHACLNFMKPEEQALSSITADEAQKYLEEGHFAEKSMYPKMEAAIQFARLGSGKRAIITDMAHAKAALRGAAGTQITLP